MAEFSNSNIVIVAAGENFPLTETAVKAPACIAHREGSGLVTSQGHMCPISLPRPARAELSISKLVIL